MVKFSLRWSSALLLLLILSCQTKSKFSSSATPPQSLDTLADLMTGYFNSAKQAAGDSSYFDISLTMTPIWENHADVKWLYVEQAVTAMKDKPYRQRVYRLSQDQNGIFESRVYELPGPERFIHAWDHPGLFATISPDSLITRQGCSVYLKLEGSCFTGSTRQDECNSSLRGATYATSKVEICPGKISSWDQGWNDENEQVWGATKGGYVFVKQDN